MGNEFYEVSTLMMANLDVKNKLYYIYAGDIDLFTRSIGRKLKFCPVDGVMITKSEEEMEAELDKSDDELRMNELTKIQNNIKKKLWQTFPQTIQS